MVAPKKAKLKEAEAELKVAMEVRICICLSGSVAFFILHSHTSSQSLNKKRADLRAVQQKLADLRAQFDENMAKKEQLERDVDMCTKKLDRWIHTHTQTHTGQQQHT